MGIVHRRHFGLLGLDVGLGGLQILQLSERRGHLRVEVWAFIPYPSGFSRDAVLADPASVTPAMRSAIDRIALAERRCRLVVPAASALSRLLSIPRGLASREIHGQVLVEAHRVLPLGVEELCMDYQILEGGDAGLLPVRLVATRREWVDQLTALVEGVGLTAEAVGIEDEVVSPALDRMRLQSGRKQEDQGAVIMDVQDEAVHLILVNRTGQVLVSRWQPRSFHASDEGLLSELRSLAERLWGEYPDFGRSPVWLLTRVHLPDDCAQRLAEQTRVPVVMGHPLDGVPSSARVLDGKACSPTAASLLACGLALQGLL